MRLSRALATGLWSVTLAWLPVVGMAQTLAIPDRGLYLGAYLDGGDAEDHVTREAMDKYEKRVGKKQAIIAFSSFWGEQSFPQEQVKIISAYGAIPLIYWSPWDRPYEQDRGPDRFSLEAIQAGRWDDYIDRWADQAKAWGKPMLVAWWCGCGHAGPTTSSGFFMRMTIRPRGRIGI